MNEEEEKATIPLNATPAPPSPPEPLKVQAASIEEILGDVMTLPTPTTGAPVMDSKHSATTEQDSLTDDAGTLFDPEIHESANGLPVYRTGRRVKGKQIFKKRRGRFNKKPALESFIPEPESYEESQAPEESAEPAEHEEEAPEVIDATPAAQQMVALEEMAAVTVFQSTKWAFSPLEKEQLVKGWARVFEKSGVSEMPVGLELLAAHAVLIGSRYQLEETKTRLFPVKLWFGKIWYKITRRKARREKEEKPARENEDS